MTHDPSWWSHFFTGLAARTLEDLYPHDQTLAEADFIEKALPGYSPARILDVPCGAGRLSLELATRGHEVEGLDICAEALERARDLARERDLAPRFVQGDMRELPYEATSFDAIVCFGNSFAYFDDAGNRAFLVACSRALRPGGVLILDTPLVAESILAGGFPPNSFHRLGEILMLREARLEPGVSRLTTDYTFLKGAEEQRLQASYRYYLFDDLRRMLEEAGFEDPVDHGGLTDERYRAGHPALVWVARRPA